MGLVCGRASPSGSAQEQDQGLVLFSEKKALLGLCSQLKSEVSLGFQLLKDVQGDSDVSLKKKKKSITLSYKEGTNLSP